MTATVVACVKPDATPTDTDSPETSASSASDSSTTGSASASDSSTTEPVPADDWDVELEPKPGARLRPIFRVVSDGSKYLLGWRDTLLDVRCTFRSGEDGVQRCYPEAQAERRFGDAACSVPIVNPSSFDEPPAKIVEVRPGGIGCRRPGTFYRLEQPFTGSAFDINSDSACEEYGPVGDGYFSVTEVSPSEFVSATITPADGASRIVPLILAADDGSRAIVGAWDREHGEPVAPGPGASDLRWFGRHDASYGHTFADAACAEPVALAICPPAGEAPGTARRFEEQGCEEVVLERRRLTAKADSTSLFRASDDQCTLASKDSALSLWSLGDVLTDADFGLATVHHVGEARLQHILYGNPEGEPFLVSDEFFDPEADAVCRFRVLGGVLACAPVDGAALENSFLDSGCTQQIANIPLIYPCTEADLPAPTWAFGDHDGAPRLLPITGPTPTWGSFKLDFEGNCVEDDWGETSHDPLAKFTVGAPTTELVTASDVLP